MLLTRRQISYLNLWSRSSQRTHIYSGRRRQLATDIFLPSTNTRTMFLSSLKTWLCLALQIISPILSFDDYCELSEPLARPYRVSVVEYQPQERVGNEALSETIRRNLVFYEQFVKDAKEQEVRKKNPSISRGHWHPSTTDNFLFDSFQIWSCSQNTVCLPRV